MKQSQALEIYKIWLAEQQRLDPKLSIRYIAGLTGKGHSSIQAAVRILVKEGLAVPVPTGETGTRQRYQMIERK